MRLHKTDFFIIGAARSGTTTLWHWLREHPQVFLPSTKEPHFFCFKDGTPPTCGDELDPHYRKLIVTDYQDYLKLFEHCAQDQLRGEASPGYLYFRTVASQIREHNPNAKIICILRDPCSRAFSQFIHHVRSGLEQLREFNSALTWEASRIADGWWWGFHYLAAGKYYEQWRTYCDQFPESQRLLLFYDDLSADPTGTYNRVCEFLEIAQAPDSMPNLRFNETECLTSVPRFSALHRALLHGTFGTRLLHPLLPKSIARGIRNAIIRLNARKKPKLSASSRSRLVEHFRSDIVQLSKLSGRDLSAWLQ